METKLSLEEKTINKLQELVQINVDSAKGFREAADEIGEGLLADKFRTIADQRAQNARELKSYVEFNGEQADTEGSYLAAMHRCWMKCREHFSTNDTYAIVAEAERGEDYIKAAYEDALKDHPGSAMSDILHNQHAAVKMDHDMIRDLQDNMKQCH